MITFLDGDLERRAITMVGLFLFDGVAHDAQLNCIVVRPNGRRTLMTERDLRARYLVIREDESLSGDR